MTDLVGRILQNHYRVDSFIGRGGMADVYKVWDQNRAVYLAMKVLHSDLAEDRAFLRRFKREADTLAKLQHPHIVRSYGLETDGRIAFILMDYIEGASLRTRIFDLERPFTPEEVLEIMQPVCAALHYAHQSGIVHCDIKPANIMLHKNGTVLVSDFGISRITEAATATMVGAGTPAYMSPEQARGEDLTPQSDIYSLGIVLYEMLSGGERPFTGERAKVTGGTSEKVRWEQINAAPPALRKVNPQISPALEAVVLKCLQKEPAQRYPSPLDALNALIQAAGSNAAPQPKAPVVLVDALPQYPAQPAKRDAILPDQSSRVDRKRSITPFVVGAVLLGLVLFFAAISRPLGVMFGPTTTEPHAITYTPTLEPTATSLPITPTLRPTATSLPITPTLQSTATSLPITPTLQSTATFMPVFAAGDVMVLEKDGMKLHYVPAGAFMMGSEDGGADQKPSHQVVLDAFWIDETEVTNAMYHLCVNIGACEPPSSVLAYKRNTYYNAAKYADYPVIYVSWNDAKTYCLWANRRLPTEAEWEKAAGGNTYTNSININLLNNDGNGFNLVTTKVGSYPAGASQYGALDMVGNTVEWVADWYSSVYYENSPSINPAGPALGDARVLRGAAWAAQEYLYVVNARSFYRSKSYPAVTSNYIGFRCAWSE